MAIITLPTTLPLGVQCTWGQQRYDLTQSSDSNGTEQVRALAPPRWVLSLTSPEHVQVANGALAQWQVLLMQLRGRVNILAGFDPLRIRPRGTMRGTITLSGSLAVGATSATLAAGSGQAGTTLLAGDLLQIGTGVGSSQLVMVMADATANGSGNTTITFEPPIRVALGSGLAVTWDRPLAYFRARGQSSSWTYGPAGLTASGMALDLLETWTP
jgi:hypothetical protein